MKTQFPSTTDKAKYCISLFVLMIIAIIHININATNTLAKETAIQFFTSSTGTSGMSKVKSPSVNVIERYRTEKKSNSQVYVFERDNGGYVIVSQCNDNCKVLGYSDNAVLKGGVIPPAIFALIENYELSDNSHVAAIKNIQDTKTVVLPLLDAANIGLNQFEHANVGDCPTGCVATAMTQIMAYHKYPARGKGSRCYTHTTYGQLCADFGNTNYNWINPTSADFEKLSYHVGVAMDMDYCGHQYGSVPGSHRYRYALRDYFNYHLITGTNKISYIKNELNNNRPVYFQLNGDLGSPGHALVIDGYNANDYLHLNFGWGGRYNGYFKLNTNSTMYAGYDFKTNIADAVFISPSPYITNKQDSLALVAFHNSMNASTGWDLSTPVSEWEGVLVINGRVVELIFYYGNNQLVGSFPPEFGNLTELTTVYLNGYFSGTFPVTISNLVNLEILSIEAEHGSTMKGTLPVDIGNLKKLRNFSVNNTFTGSIPESIGELTELIYFNIPNGKLSGNIPSSLCNLTKLESLDFSGHELTGNIPATIGQLDKLIKLNLSNNKLAGPVPESIGSLALLTDLHLNNNSLEGDIPVELGNLHELKEIDLSFNKFTSFTDEIGNNVKLEILKISNNNLSTLPVSINKLKNLNTLWASNNKISVLAENFGTLPKLVDVDLSKNQLTVFPYELCFSPNLTTFQLQNNKIKNLPQTVDYISPLLNTFDISNNEMEGKIPSSLLESKILIFEMNNNRFKFEDLPVSENLKHGIGLQKPIKVSKNKIKVMMGDTVNIDVRNLTGAYHQGNEFYWCKYPEYLTEERSFELRHAIKKHTLEVVINEKTINNKYYCKIFNPQSSTYSYISSGTTIPNLPCLEYVNTDTISFQLVNDEEMYAEEFPDSYVVSSKNLTTKEVDDKTVTLVPPLKKRGIIRWQTSADKNVWYDLSTNMTQTDLKANFLSVSDNKLVLSPITPAYYRTALIDGNCDPLYSDTIKVNPFGKVLKDTTVNVTNKAVTIAVDSIEVTIPANLYNEDFRLTVVKLDNPPHAPLGQKLGSVYDVTVSFGDVFSSPLVIKLKNVDLNEINDSTIMNYKPVYYDDINQQWVEYENGGIALKDSSIVFYTSHLTKLSWWDSKEYLSGYTDVFERDGVRVVWTEKDESYFKFIYEKKQKPQPWHQPGTPVYIQDIAQYMTEIIAKLRSLGLRFSYKPITVYVKEMSDEGVVGLMGMINHYISINRDIANPIALRSLLAHEYMHYIQDSYMVPSPGNIFWMEANAHLTDRIVWDESVIPISQSDEYLMNFRGGQVSMYNFLSKSWDYWDRTTLTQNALGDINFCYLAGTFIHYMRSYRDGEKLKPEVLLRETPNFGSWRAYLDSYIQQYLKSDIGNEYENFVKYILQPNPNFTLLNIDENTNPFNLIINNIYGFRDKGIGDAFVCNFTDKQEPKTETFEIEVPYLATKIMILGNMTYNKAAVINYKPRHDMNDQYKVYHGRYDFENKKTVFVDISDSTSYNIFLESAKEDALYQAQHIGFLMFINKKSPSTFEMGSSFNASFELTASPVIDFFDLDYISVDNKTIHNYDDQTKDYFYIANLGGLQKNLPGSEYRRIKKNLNSSSYEIISSYSYVSVSKSNPDLPSNIMKTEIVQSTEYNYIDGSFDIVQNLTLTYRLGAYYDVVLQKEMPERLWIIDNKLTRIKIKGAFVFYPTTESQLFYSTSGTSETINAIKSMSCVKTRTEYDSKGEVTSSSTKRYVDTDYSLGDVKVLLWLYVK